MKLDGKRIGVELRALRIKNKRNALETSKYLGINIGTFYKYERDASQLNIELLEKLLDYYGTNIYIFFNKIVEYKQQGEE